jgi:hypothetical protein
MASLFAVFAALAPALGCTLLTGADRLAAIGCDEPCTVDQTGNSIEPRPQPNGASPKDGDRSPVNSNSGADDDDAGKGPASSSDAATTPKDPTIPKSPLQCDGFMCSGSTPHCCQLQTARGHCVGVSEACAGTRVSCGGPQDCEAGEVCCGSGNLARCLPSNECAGTDASILCNDNQECPSEKTCGAGDARFEHRVCQ